MAEQIDVVFEGGLTTRCIYRPTGQEIWTDAPLDNLGKGESISPTDLVGAALGSCIITLMAIAAKKIGVSIEGTRLEVSKEMAKNLPRRIGKLVVVVKCPQKFSPEITEKLEKAGGECPVHHSLNPEIVQEITFRWGA